ncbi:MAG: RtcB family protein [Candidatus Limivivens sp.]|nr:RtcB family protein [Candidatus Limivivens sp.]
MRIIDGIYSSAVVFTTENPEYAIDDYAVAQIKMLCDNEASKGCKIRIMPDVHPGKVGTIGLTMTVGKRILPNLIGIDIGCGMSLIKIKQKKIEYQKLDAVIREGIPAGFRVRKQPHRYSEQFDFSGLRCGKSIRKEKAVLSLGTLGGGNHFIEADRNEEGSIYVVVHSGSRHLGKEVTEFYLKEGQRELKEKGEEVPYELTYLEGKLMDDYLHDLQIVQEFASLNRAAILDVLIKGMKWKVLEERSCVHNYVQEIGDGSILRKGAISAQAGEKVIIPIHMRDGVILGTGLGNAEWNYSAPHGGGRILKREDVAKRYTVSSFKAEMKGVYSSCISQDTLDEAPFAYRSLPEIQSVISETVKTDQVLKPVYNYKAGGSQ